MAERMPPAEPGDGLASTGSANEGVLPERVEGSQGAGGGLASTGPTSEAAKRMPRRERSLAVLIVNQLLAGVGVASGIALAAILVADLTGVPALGGLAQSSTVLGAAIAAIPLARLAVKAGRHVALGVGYACAAAGAVLVIVAATSGWALFVFVGLAAFGAATAAGLQARFAATELASPGFEARSMSVVLWATTIGSVAGPLLSEVGDRLGRSLGLPELVGPFLFSTVAFTASTVLVTTLLRVPRAGTLAGDAATAQPMITDLGDPQPAPIAAATAGAETSALPSTTPETSARPNPKPAERRVGSWQALRIASGDPRARVAILAIVCSHTVMVGVMVMTPVHMTQHGLSLSLVGLVLSLHILGMYGASPLIGWLADRIGSLRVIAIGAAVLITAALIGILAPAGDMVFIPLALGLLGLGWSAGLIGGSTLLATTVSPSVRVPLQGATDAAMNVAAAASAAMSGVVLGAFGFAGVNVVALLVLVPLGIAAALIVGVRPRAAV